MNIWYFIKVCLYEYFRMILNAHLHCKAYWIIAVSKWHFAYPRLGSNPTNLMILSLIAPILASSPTLLLPGILAWQGVHTMVTILLWVSSWRFKYYSKTRLELKVPIATRSYLSRISHTSYMVPKFSQKLILYAHIIKLQSKNTISSKQHQ